MSHSVVRFPPPPPTSNNLTSKQRAQLMRSSKKLGQVLGSTPHVLDWTRSPAPVDADIPSRSSSIQSHYSSLGHRRSKSSPHAARDYNAPCTPPRPSTASSSHSHVSSTGHASSSSSRGEQAWRTPYDPLCRPPLLKLQPPGLPSHSVHGQRSSTYSDCGSDISMPDSPTAPSFALPSEAAVRRAKMQRLTRKLGDGVPPELVFPTASRPELDWESDEDSPLLETPASDRKLPFSQVLPTIPERRPATTSFKTHVEIVAKPVHLSRVGGDRRSYRNAIYVIDSPDEHGLGDGWGVVCIGDPTTKHKSTDRFTELSSKRENSRPGDAVCLGVSASAGPVGGGRSGRWVKGTVALDQIAAPGWHGGVW